MDTASFDALTKSLASPASRRRTLRLLAGSLLGGLLAQPGAPTRAAQRLDRDGDGLFDDDEITIYGANPDRFDTDSDGVGDGEEVFLGTDPLTRPAGGPAPQVCAHQGQSCAEAVCCLGFCNQDALCECVADGFGCAGIGAGGCCNGQPCNASGFCGTCASLGARCNADAECCQGSYAALCCFDGVSLTTRCTDVTNIGFVCPGDAPAPGACPAGQTDCGGSCVDLASHAGHCGVCFNSCPLGGVCQGGVCGGIICMGGETDCGGYCADLLNDEYNCGACHNLCDSGVCTNGSCGAICFGPGTLCTADSDCCSGDCFGVCL